LGGVWLKKRIKKVFESLKKKPDAILIKNSSEPFIDNNFFYVTGLEKGLFEGCATVLFPDGNAELIVSELEAELAKKANININLYKTSKGFNDVLKKSISSFESIGLNYNGLTCGEFTKLIKKFPSVKFLDISKSFSKARLVKDKAEIDLIKSACKISEIVMEKIPGIFHKGMFEYELAAEIDYLMMKNGADKVAFETISSFGKNSAEPHYSHGKTKLNKKDFVLCDFGACFRKYNSDITRTFVFGSASKKQKDMYETVLDAQRIGIDFIRPGIKAKDVHKQVSIHIDNTNFKGKFIHSTGHSLGLAVHDPGGGLNVDCDLELKENMIFTVEPGVYIPGFGGVRIEDDVLVTKNGVEVLTKYPRELVEI
jgi:Xaa-Pro dipeptidase